MGFLEMSRENKVDEFRRAGDKKNYKDGAGEAEGDLITRLIIEEMEEFAEASLDYEENPNEETRAQLCKEWADLQYVVSQAAVYYDIPADPAFNRVHNSNMTKVVDGKVLYRPDGKIEKGPDYRKPDMRGL